MLRELRIKNFAVIDEVGLELKSGLNIITGETGAGKSIILNALGLIAGERGSSDVIRNKEEEAAAQVSRTERRRHCQGGAQPDHRFGNLRRQ